MNNKPAIVISIVALLISVIAGYVTVSTKAPGFNPLGAAGGLQAEDYIPYVMYNDGYKSAKNIELTGASGDLTVGDDATISDDLTVSGGVLNVTTTNTATSSLTVGCIQTTATSTATPVRLSATTTAAGGTYLMVVFGTCPF